MKPYLTIALLSSLTLTSCADNSPGGKAVQTRHKHFKDIGKAFKDINGQLKDSAPDLTAIKANATQIAGLAPHIKEWFPVGSGPQDGRRTDAKAQVWTQPAAFQQAATRLAHAAAQLKTTAEFGNVVATGVSAKALGLACKDCHDKFKED
jgi:cytochrome c556